MVCRNNGSQSQGWCLMFEDSLMESQNRLSSPNQRWTTILSLTFQCSLVAAMIALPLMHPDKLPFHIDTPKVVLSLKRPVVVHTEVARATSAAAPTTGNPVTAPRLIPNTIMKATQEGPPATTIVGTGMTDTNGIPSSLASASAIGPRLNIAPANPASKGILHVSTGVSAGLLLAPITPVYPRIAISARVEGVVRVEAIISKAGRIESAHVVSGPAMLHEAALEAIQNARYTPYLLNGSPTEVETTITVNFKLSS